MLNIKKLLTKILDMLNINALTFTKAQSASTANIVARRVGHVVTVNGYISGMSLASGENHIGTISVSGYLPAASVRTYCNVGANAYSVGTLSYLVMSTDGKLYITTSNTGSNKVAYFSFSYSR